MVGSINTKTVFLYYMLFSILMTSCAHVKKQSREEWIKAQARTYKNITSKSILEASEKIFTLSDESDFSFSYKPNELIARKNWLLYFVLSFSTGTDVWRIQTQESNNETLVTIELEVTTGRRKAGPAHTSTYKIFWARLDYLLGLREDWMTCDQFDEIDPYSNHGGLSYGLCGIYTDDNKPQKPEK